MFPDPGKLTEQDKKRVIKYLTERGFHLRSICPVCASQEWFIGDHLVMPPVLTPNVGLSIGGPGYPLAMVISKGCGYTLFINAVILGLMPSPQDEQRAFEEGFKGTKGGTNG
jgi:hypothetical protein